MIFRSKIIYLKFPFLTNFLSPTESIPRALLRADVSVVSSPYVYVYVCMFPQRSSLDRARKYTIQSEIWSYGLLVFSAPSDTAQSETSATHAWRIYVYNGSKRNIRGWKNTVSAFHFIGLDKWIVTYIGGNNILHYAVLGSYHYSSSHYSCQIYIMLIF